MTVRLIAPNGTAATEYVPDARDTDHAIVTAQSRHPRGWFPAWVLPGDCR